MRGGDDADQVRAVASLLQPVGTTGRPVSQLAARRPPSASGAARAALPLPSRPVNAGTPTGSSTWRATGRPTSAATRS